MKRRRRRRTSRRTYTIAYLLARQPKTLAKQPQYREMLIHFHSSERLHDLKLNSRCYALLNSARIEPNNLHDFYRTYRLPKDPFFPLFFAAKRSYLKERERIKEERRRYIVESVRSLPAPVLTAIKYLGHLERRYNAAGRSPVWQEELFPSTKKKAGEYRRFDSADWLHLFSTHLTTLRRRYPRFPENVAERIRACITLDLLPAVDGSSDITGRHSQVPAKGGAPAVCVPPQPSVKEVRRSYRRLSMLHHPDRGGDGAMFIQIKKARDLLLGDQR